MPEKKPKRLEILTAIIATLVGLQALGVFDAIREGIKRWLTE